jgi:hypothetical protein
VSLPVTSPLATGAVDFDKPDVLQGGTEIFPNAQELSISEAGANLGNVTLSSGCGANPDQQRR